MKAHLSTEDDIIAENDDLGRMAALLQASCDFRVLQRLKPRSIFEPRDGSPTRRALLVDVETTGLDPKSDEVIELALLPVVYGLDGRIFEVGEAFVNLRQPTRQIPAAVTYSGNVCGETSDLRPPLLSTRRDNSYRHRRQLIIDNPSVIVARWLARFLVDRRRKQGDSPVRQCEIRK